MATALRIRLSVLAAVALIAGGAIALLQVPLTAKGSKGKQRSSADKVWPRFHYPPRRAIHRAQEFAASRGDVSFAVVGSSVGLRGYDPDTPYSSASVSKALLLAAELRRLRREDEPLDSATKTLLEPMITLSDNRAADAIYARVGDAGLEEVARHAGMQSFAVTPGFWGGNQVTAADLARFFHRLDANLPAKHRAYGKRLLAGITPVERWGIPEAIGRGWSIWFKGGWRPAGQEQTSGPVTHQAALLAHRNGERVALAVLTNEAPGSGAGFDAIEGIAARLFKEPPLRQGDWVAP